MLVPVAVADFTGNPQGGDGDGHGEGGTDTISSHLLRCPGGLGL